MNASLITEAARATLTGTKSFPEIVGMLLTAGVEYYHVDYAGRRKSFYGPDGELVVTAIDYEGLPAVQATLNVAALRSAILDSQQRSNAD